MTTFLTVRSAAKWLREHYPEEHAPSHVTIRKAIVDGKLPGVRIPLGVGERMLFILDAEDVKSWWGKWRKLHHRGPKPGSKRSKK